MSQGGIGLLARTADDAEDPQTLRMVAGAIANLCGNGASLSHPFYCQLSSNDFQIYTAILVFHIVYPFVIGLPIL
jgi:predicted metalloprotease